MKFLSRAVLAVSTMITTEVYAQDADGQWIRPATTLIESVQGGLVSIGAIIVGVGITLVGLWAGATGKMEMMRVGTIIFSGILITAGPSALELLFS